MPHDVPVIYRHRCHSCPQVHEGHAVFHFRVPQNGLCSGFGCEIFLDHIYPESFECDIYVPEILLLAYEQLEVSLKDFPGHPDYVIFGKADLVPIGKRLCHSSEQFLTLRMIKRIGVHGHPFHVIDFVL